MRIPKSLSKIGGFFILGDASHSRKRKQSDLVPGSFNDESKKRRIDSELNAMLSSSMSLGDTPRDFSVPLSHVPDSPALPDTTATRRTTPDDEALKLSQAWQNCLPGLIADIQQFYRTASGRPVTSVVDLVDDQCPATCSTRSETKVLALYFGHFTSVTVRHCPCRSVSQTLVKVGLFPTAPSQPRTAVSIELLNFYSCLFERSCDAVTAFAGALNAFYTRRECDLLNSEGERVREPFRRGLGYAAQWLDVLHVMLKDQLDLALKAADEEIRKPTPDIINKPNPPPQEYNVQPSNAEIASDRTSTSTTQPLIECTRYLQTLCPACFGGSEFGKPLLQGADIHVSTDGCFQHRHLVSGGRGIPAFEPKQILPKAFVDAVGERIEKARKGPRKPRKPKVPDEAVDGCQASFEAAEGDKRKGVASGPRYDAQGWMALTCRHDVPLMLANIDTPGEQQKYAVSLILWLFSQLPEAATVTFLYDIACVLDRSLQLYDILSVSITNRLIFATSVLHAYSHQWACQLAHNPRFMKGLGFSDGEGVERTWSKLRMLISIIRTSSLAKRASLTARQVDHIASEVLNGLGDWVSNRQRKVVEEGTKARDVLQSCSRTLEELEHQWSLQKDSQLSIRAHAPARLKKELDAVIALQDDIERIEKAIQTTKTGLSAAANIPVSIFDMLSATHADLVKTADKLFASLNLDTGFPELAGVDIEFVHVLLLARDLKINIRKRVIETFFEWDRLDQAVGGRNIPLGTKSYKMTRTAMKKREPSLMKAIIKFNQYCDRLKGLHKPSYCIPLPVPVLLQLSELKDDIDFMQDVWITPTPKDLPEWLTDSEVRTGIQGMLKLEHCGEEDGRLESEARNMGSWLGRSLAAADLALSKPCNSSMSLSILQHRANLLNLKARWSRSLPQSYEFDTHVRAALTSAHANLAEQQRAHPVSCLYPSHPRTETVVPEEDPSDALASQNDAELPILSPTDLLLLDIFETALEIDSPEVDVD